VIQTANDNTRVLISIFICAFTGVYLKYAIVSEQLIVPKLEDLVLRYRSLKLLAKVLDFNFLLFVCRLGRAPWETRMASGWRGYVWSLMKSGAFRDSAQNVLETPTGIYVKHYFHAYCINTFIIYIKYKMYLQANTNG
jgi:hypothetical protein